MTRNEEYITMTTQDAVAWCNEQMSQPDYGVQPLRFFSLYYQFLTGRNPHADGVLLTSAKSVWCATPAGFTRTGNIDQLPPSGALIFWDDTVAVVDKADAMDITVWEEVPGVGVQHTKHVLPELPLRGWWVWDGLSNESVAADPEPIVIQPSKPGSIYTWVQGDTIWRVAPRFGLQAAELLEHNNIADWHSIRPGDLLHLPIPRPIVADYELSVEVLESHQPMHICRDGARKVSFGYGKSFDALPPVGPRLARNARQTVVAIAHVRIRDDRRDFYMDAAALGDYRVTKRVRYMIGFHAEDLEEGYVSRQLSRAVVGWGL